MVRPEKSVSGQTAEAVIAAEADLFCRYMLHTGANENLLNRYLQTLTERGELEPISSAGRRQLAFVREHPWSLGMIDGAAALSGTGNELRARLYLFLAIAEATPDYGHYFLPAKHGKLYLLTIGWLGFKAIFRTGAGMVMLKTMRLN